MAGPVLLRIVWNRDQTKAFIFPESGWFHSTKYEFSFHYRGDSALELGLVTHNGGIIVGTDDEPIRLKVSLT